MNRRACPTRSAPSPKTGAGILEIDAAGSNLPWERCKTSSMSSRKPADSGHRLRPWGRPGLRAGRQAGCMGFYLPAMRKEDLFTTVIWTARCRARRSPWVKPGKNDSIWKPAN